MPEAYWADSSIELSQQNFLQAQFVNRNRVEQNTTEFNKDVSSCNNRPITTTLSSSLTSMFDRAEVVSAMKTKSNLSYLAQNEAVLPVSNLNSLASSSSINSSQEIFPAELLFSTNQALQQSSSSLFNNSSGEQSDGYIFHRNMNSRNSSGSNWMGRLREKEEKPKSTPEWKFRVRLTSTAYFELAVCPKEEVASTNQAEERSLFEQILMSSAIGIGLTSNERYDMHSFPGWRRVRCLSQRRWKALSRGTKLVLIVPILN